MAISIIDACNGICGTGQANTVYGTASTIAKEAAKAIKLRYTRAIRNCMVSA